MPTLIAGFMASTGCALILPGHFWRVVAEPNGTVLHYDTPELRQLINDEDAREEAIRRSWREPHSSEQGMDRIRDMMKHPDQYPPGRKEFLSAMNALPGLIVRSRPYCEVVERSKCTCGRSPIETAVYVKVRITTGPLKGREGWVCWSHVQQQFP